MLLAWDAETATGGPRLPNELVADACERFEDVFSGFGSADPHKGDAAVAEVARIRSLGLRRAKLHPSMQRFAPEDERHLPLFAACADAGLPVLVHTGTSGIGAGTPGGQGIRIDLAHPLRLDPVAALPSLTVIAAHTGRPWHLDLIAMAVHKTNVVIDISGWAPRRLAAEEVRRLAAEEVREKGRRLSRQTVFGSDYPLISPQRCLDELHELELSGKARSLIFAGNATRILGLPDGG